MHFNFPIKNNGIRLLFKKSIVNTFSIIDDTDNEGCIHSNYYVEIECIHPANSK